jgi:Glycosyl hydrolases family 18
MPQSSSLRAGISALSLAAMATGLVAVAGPAAQASSQQPAQALPAHVFAPYFEAYNGDDPYTLSKESGAKYLTFAFIQTAAAGSCTAYWNGDTTQPLTSATFGSEIADIQKHGGDVIPSFGGYGADTTDTDIADSCTSVPAIAQVYENVLTTYNVSRIDLDIEADSLSNTAGITRRDQAVALVEAWGRQNHRPVQFSYTLPSATTGLGATGVAVLQDAKAQGAKVAVVNAMTFDYYIGTAQEMAADTETAGQGVFDQIQALYPHYSAKRIWDMIGITEMPGIDDFGAPETFTEADAATVLQWAEAKGINTLSFWALQRDNGGCVGTQGAGSCSGIAQNTWFFSNLFEPFTH